VVVAGNIGSERRSKYGVVGHTVNLTARIESLHRLPARSLPRRTPSTKSARPARPAAAFSARPKGMAAEVTDPCDHRPARRATDTGQEPARHEEYAHDAYPAGRGQRDEPRHALAPPCPQGLRGAAATDGEQAVTIDASTQLPDLVLLDMNLPLKDGWSAAREIRADARCQGIPHHRADRACDVR
jgi:hypothetical protein